MAMPTALVGDLDGGFVMVSAAGWLMKPPRSVGREKGVVSSDIGGVSVVLVGSRVAV